MLSVKKFWGEFPNGIVFLSGVYGVTFFLLGVRTFDGLHWRLLFGSSFLSLCTITRTVTRNCYWGYTKVNPLVSSCFTCNNGEIEESNWLFCWFFSSKNWGSLANPPSFGNDSELPPPFPQNREKYKKNPANLRHSKKHLRLSSETLVI